MEFGNIGSKIIGNADKIGMILGGVGYVATAVDPDILRGAMAIVTDLTKKPHFPNLQHVMNNLMYEQGPFMMGAKAAIVGYILNELDVLPQLSKLGKFLMEAGIGAAEASAAVALVTFSGHYASEGADAGLGGGSHFEFLSGSRHNPHGAYTEGSVAPYGTNLTRSAAGSPNPYT